MGVVVLRRYIDILTIIINFPYSPCISSFFAAASRLLCSFLKWFFRSCKNKNKNKAAFTLGRGPGSGAGPAQVRVFTLHFADSHFSGLGSSGHGFPNRARRFGPGSGLIKPAF